MEMWEVPNVKLGDSSNWEEEERNSEMADWGRKVIGSDQLLEPYSIPRLKCSTCLTEFVLEIKHMYVDRGGYTLTVSDAGEIKRTKITENSKNTHTFLWSHSRSQVCCHQQRKTLHWGMGFRIGHKSPD